MPNKGPISTRDTFSPKAVTESSVTRVSAESSNGSISIPSSKAPARCPSLQKKVIEAQPTGFNTFPTNVIRQASHPIKSITAT